MSIRFAIQNTVNKAVKEGDYTVRFSGTAEPFKRLCDRKLTLLGRDAQGNPKYKFVTGLETDRVDFMPWFTEEEKKVVKKTITSYRPLIASYYQGEDVIADSNEFLWRKDKRVSRLGLTNEKIGMFYDTKNPEHALLYLSILSGAFLDIVAPNKQWAMDHQVPHFLMLETDESESDDDEIRKSDAHYYLKKLRDDADGDALFILAWCIQYETATFGAYRRSTPRKDLINYHIKYIDGKIVTRNKKNCPKNFLEYVEKWENPQTRQTLFVEAYVLAGEYYNFLTSKEKRFNTPDGTVLGATIDEAVKTLMKPKMRDVLDDLRTKVEAKWNE